MTAEATSRFGHTLLNTAELVDPPGACGSSIGVNPIFDPTGYQDSDPELWRKSLDGDQFAFGQLFERHQRIIFQRSLAATGDRQAAEEIVSMTFLETWRRRKSVHIADSMRPWLLGVSSNLVKSYWRSSKRYANLLAKLPASADSDDQRDAVDSGLDSRVRVRRIAKLLNRMPQEDRDVIRLCAFVGLTHVEAAELLEIPVGTVKSKLSRARARLREADQFGRSNSHRLNTDIPLGEAT